MPAKTQRDAEPSQNSEMNVLAAVVAVASAAAIAWWKAVPFVLGLFH